VGPAAERPQEQAASAEQEVLAPSAAYREDRAPAASRPPKSIVLCLDGTGNQYGENNTNVVLLNRVVERSERQLVYYDPGVGTASLKPTLTSLARYWQRAIGLAFGYGLEQNVIEAYRYLMNTVEPGDTVYLFGFSRGAYTARVVAALIHAVGILPKNHDNLIGSALGVLKTKGFDRPRLLGFRAQFARHDTQGELIRPRVVLGLWDTVSSVSWVFDQVSYRYTTRNPSVGVARHAVALDERRAFFRTNLLKPWTRKNEAGEVTSQDLKQVWFAGVHSDIGGGYPMQESGLAKLTLEWMMVELQGYGLRFTEEAEALLYPGTSGPLVPAARGASPVPPDPLGPRHNSLQGPWWACEFWPKQPWDPRTRKTHLRFNRGRTRWVPTAEPGTLDLPLPVLHASVIERLEGSDYAPSNLPPNWALEDRARFARVATPPGLEDSLAKAREAPSAAPKPAPRGSSPEPAEEPMNAFFPGLLAFLSALFLGYLFVALIVFLVRCCQIGWWAQSPWAALGWPAALFKFVQGG